MRRLLSGLPP